MKLMDMGKASAVTRGYLSGFFTEAGFGPYNRYDCHPGSTYPLCPHFKK